VEDGARIQFFTPDGQFAPFGDIEFRSEGRLYAITGDKSGRSVQVYEAAMTHAETISWGSLKVRYR
jgi:hypothetical protein